MSTARKAIAILPLIALLMLASALTLTGCTPKEPADPRENWISKEEMLNHPGGTFVERNGEYLCIISKAEEDHWSTGYRWEYATDECYYFVGSNDPNDVLFSFQKEDRLVSTEEANLIAFNSVESEGYCKLNQNPRRMGYEEVIQGDCVFGGTVLTDYDEVLLMEIDGQEFRGSGRSLSVDADNARKILTSKGVMTVNDKDDGCYYTSEPMTIEAGYYDGTKWIDAPIEFNTPFLITTEAYKSYAEKTKEGFFIFDISEAKPGEYLMDGYKITIEQP